MRIVVPGAAQAAACLELLAADASVRIARVKNSLQESHDPARTAGFRVRPTPCRAAGWRARGPSARVAAALRTA